MKPYVGNVGIAVKCRSKQMSECIINIYKIITVYYWTVTDGTVWSKPCLFDYLTFKNPQVNIKNIAFLALYQIISLKTNAVGIYMFHWSS